MAKRDYNDHMHTFVNIDDAAADDTAGSDPS